MRRIVRNLNIGKRVALEVRRPQEPLYPAEEIYGVIPDNVVRKPLDMRESYNFV